MSGERLFGAVRAEPLPSVIAALRQHRRQVGQGVELKVVPTGSFSYDGTRPLNQAEITQLINGELLRRGFYLVEEGGGLAVQGADVAADRITEVKVTLVAEGAEPPKEAGSVRESRAAPTAEDLFARTVSRTAKAMRLKDAGHVTAKGNGPGAWEAYGQMIFWTQP